MKKYLALFAALLLVVVVSFSTTASADPMELVCDDLVDNDGDSEVDCTDLDCAEDSDCQEWTVSCTDMIDNDNDGYIDCEDTDCLSDPACNEVWL